MNAALKRSYAQVAIDCVREMEAEGYTLASLTRRLAAHGIVVRMEEDGCDVFIPLAALDSPDVAFAAAHWIKLASARRTILRAMSGTESEYLI